MIIEFDYVQPGHVQHVLGKLVNIRDTHGNPLLYATLFKGKYKIQNRSRYLMMVALTDGRIKQYYDSSIINARKVGLIRRYHLWRAGVNFRKVAYV